MSPIDRDLFKELRDRLVDMDPVSFCERHLTLDGNPFRLTGNGYKPFADIYRYIGIKSLEPGALPVVMVKGRQVGGTTMAAALEMYFMGCGAFGTGGKPPMRIMHAFPHLEAAAAYSKTKLNPMISSSVIDEEDAINNKSGKIKSFMQKMLDQTSSTTDSLSFKQFINDNHIWVDSTGVDADRLRGRQLCLETDIPIPTGFIKLRNLKEGDDLFDENGNICKVTKMHPINFTPEAYRLIFDDGTTVDACSEHLWFTFTKNDRVKQARFEHGKRKNNAMPTVKNTKELLLTLKKKYKNFLETNHSIPNTKPVNYPEKKLLIDPYILGIWLGDGCANGTIELLPEDAYILGTTEQYKYHVLPHSVNREISKASSYRIRGLTQHLRELNLAVNNHKRKNNYYKKIMPNDYLLSSFEQRLSLLQGLMDSDGHCDKNGRCEITSTQYDLANDIYKLLLSLGIKVNLLESEHFRYDKKNANRFRMQFVTRLPVFRLKRKLDRQKKTNKARFMSEHRYLVDIKPIQSKPMRCITVDSPSHLFLITKQFIPTHNTVDAIFFDEVQDTPGEALTNATKILAKSHYGRVGKGVQVYFGTPKKKGSDFYKMWEASNQQYYHLGCEKCKEYFPLYTPGSDDWEKVWLYGFIVKCTHCGHEQHKDGAAERGKWKGLKEESESTAIGFHINQLYMPGFTKETILAEKPGIHPINTERVYQNEVLGEFFQGDSSPISEEDIRVNCGDVGRKMRGRIMPGEEKFVVMGIDYGGRADIEQLANPNKSKMAGQSYSTAVILKANGPNLLSIEFATKFKKNDMESKKGLIDSMMRQYSVELAVGDIGYSNDFSEVMHTSYGNRYLVSRAHNKVNDKVKFKKDDFPKEILFERDHYIGELFDLMKKGQVRFPYGDYERISWLIAHCASMDIQPSLSKFGDHTIHYVKGNTPNDGLMALLNAYLAYKFLITKGFTSNNPLVIEANMNANKKPLVTTGVIRRRF